MRVERVYVRFFKAFNFDYLRKFSRDGKPDPWDMLGDVWQPYVRVPIEPELTAIVGANESGKSQLLDAIKHALTAQEIDRADFCRYSNYFAVEEGKLRAPDFGLQLGSLSDAHAAELSSLLGEGMALTDPFWIFRENRVTAVYAGPDRTKTELDATQAEQVGALLPRVVPIDPDLPLPDSVPLRFLIGKPRPRRLLRKSLGSLVDLIEEHSEWLGSAQTLAQAAPNIHEAVGGTNALVQETDRLARSYALARDLLFQIALVAPDAIADLERAVRDEREGYASAIIEEINHAIAARLNLRRWWSQDRDFELVVSAHEQDLIFTVRDRTGSQYSFGERSQGLKYFLSYLIQFLAHQPDPGRDELMLMDEPDAYLSSQGQQDLLRVFSEFVTPTVVDRPPAQLIYVTHSPYLIDRNHAERVRVLDKGEGDEGTRVVRDIAQNHYEPLRSSFGSFVAETAFIGNTNLFVEGQADQVLLAGMSVVARAAGAPASEALDLNEITIVPSGSASELPYLVYLARGRGVDRPAAVVLLDSDSAGDDARRKLLKKPVGRGRIIDEKFVLQIGKVQALQLSQSVSGAEIEDLIPMSIALHAARSYAVDVGIVNPKKAPSLMEAQVAAHLPGSLLDSLRAGMQDAYGSGVHMEKVGFARHVIGAAQDSAVSTSDRATLVANFRKLFADLNPRLREAQKQIQEQRLAARIDRVKSNFASDNPLTAAREAGRLIITDIGGVLDDSDESADVRAELEKIRREFELDKDLLSPILDYPHFLESLDRLKYVGRLAQLTPEEEQMPDGDPAAADDVADVPQADDDHLEQTNEPAD